ncbi:MAG: glycosyltransferase, partial [Bacteroidaceae bacterium]|nr:glycosyltransferase [Bacteroidaceae bacterium]
CLVVLTEKDRESWVELDHVTVIPDPLSLYPQSVAPLTEKRVVSIARYSHEKGIDLLLKAWKEVEDNFGDWQLDVYGDGEPTPYERLIDELNIDRSRCHLHGRTNDVEREYCHSSLFVLSSRFEGFGMVMTEAMACGLPVVAFDCPWGPRSIINDGVDGLLAANGDVSDLAQKMGSVMGNGHLLTSMARSAVLNVQRYNIQHIAETWKRLFEEIMASENK